MSYSEPPPPPQYGAPQPGTPSQPPKNSGMSVAALVLGIIGVIPCFWGCFIFGILGVVFGVLGKRDIASSNGAKKGAGMAQAGLILGAIAIALGIIYWILYATGAIDFSYDYETS